MRHGLVSSQFPKKVMSDPPHCRVCPVVWVCYARRQPHAASRLLLCAQALAPTGTSHIMTSLTGKTEATLPGTVSPPSFAGAFAGALAQLSIVGYSWYRYTSMGACLDAPGMDTCWADPWSRNVVLTIALSLTLWLYSLRTIPSTGSSDPSIVDRCWSILPVLYAWHFALSAPPAAKPRLLLMALLATIWGSRLTYNFALKGGFSGGEDYRWAEIRKWPGFVRGWELFNLTFICLFQQIAVLAFTSAAAGALRPDAAPLNALDALACTLYLLLVCGEAVADAQMLAFQTEKYRRLRDGEVPGPANPHPHPSPSPLTLTPHPHPSHSGEGRLLDVLNAAAAWWLQPLRAAHLAASACSYRCAPIERVRGRCRSYREHRSGVGGQHIC